MTTNIKVQLWERAYACMKEALKSTNLQPTQFRFEETEGSWEEAWTSAKESLAYIGEIFDNWGEERGVDLLEDLEDLALTPRSIAGVLYACHHPYSQWLSFAMVLECVYHKWPSAAALAILTEDELALHYISQQPLEYPNPFEQKYWKAFMEKDSSNHSNKQQAMQHLVHLIDPEFSNSFDDIALYEIYHFENAVAKLYLHRGLSKQDLTEINARFYGWALATGPTPINWEVLTHDFLT